MPPKRKLTLKLSSNKRQNTKSHSNSSLVSFYNSIITQLNTLKDQKTNELIIGPFLKLPSKKIFPDYYKIIKSPISINEIKSKFLAKKKSNGNLSINEFIKGFKLLKDNAITYNDPESLIAKDATTVYNFVESNVEEFNKSNNDLVDEEKDEDAQEEEEEQEEQEENDDEENEEDENEDDENEDAIENDTNINETRKSLNIPDEFINNPNDNDNIDMECDDISEDYTVELFKVLRHLLNFKVSHHKNSQPLSVPFLNLVDKTIYPNYYKLIKNPMSFNIIKLKLENNNYSQGSIGYRKFVRDINLIFDNARIFNEEGSIIYKNATSLGKAFIKRIEKFNIQIVEKRRNLILNAKLEKEIEEKELEKNKLDKELEKKKERDIEKQLEIENQLNNKIKNNNNNNINNENFENESELDNLNDKTNYNSQLKPEVPNFVRKHDIEKAVKIEEIDDITAFIKKFILKSNYSLINNDNYFENVIFEPAGNSTIGGSIYSTQLSSNLVIGKEISCLIYLQNKIIDEKYITEFKVNNEIIKSQPMTIDYDELQGENGEFLACKFEFKIGYGLNQFEFNLKVPFPLKDMDLLSKRSTTNQEFIETVKLWVVVTN